MPWIENCSADDIPKGLHHAAGINSMLIQIMDPASRFPIPKHQFKESHFFRFLDIERDDDCFDEECRVSDTQARDLVRLLQQAFAKRMNVVVHCFAGMCRSGAVVEVGVMLGFTAVEKFRFPNLLVKHKMLTVLNLPFDENEKPDADAWRQMLG